MPTLIALNPKAVEFTSKPLKMLIGGQWVMHNFRKKNRN